MPTINVPLWQFILSQAFGIAMILCEVVALSKKNKITTLRFFIGTNFASAIMWALLGDWLGLGLGISGILRNGIFIFMERRRGREYFVGYPLKILVIMIGLQLIPFAFMFAPTLFHFVLMAVVPLQIWSVWAGGIHKLRIIGAAWSAVFFFHAWQFINVVSMILSVAVVVSILVFYARYFSQRRSRQIVHY